MMERRRSGRPQQLIMTNMCRSNFAAYARQNARELPGPSGVGLAAASVVSETGCGKRQEDQDRHLSSAEVGDALFGRDGLA
jgi:hypothetical protein